MSRMHTGKYLLRSTILLAAMGASMACNAGVYKCVAESGAVSYQERPCGTGSSSETVRLAPSPVPDAPGSQADFETGRSSANRQTLTPEEVRANDKAIRQTWEGFTDALGRGDKESALRHMTPAAREKYEPVLDRLMNDGAKR